MKTFVAARIVSKCINYKEKFGFWPEPMNRSDRRNIIHAFKITNYKQGDFSFIKNGFKRQALEHDYDLVCRTNAWNALRYHDCQDDFIDDTYGGIWDIIYYGMFFHHNKETAKMSLENLEYISKNGWEKYVLKNLK